MDAGSGDSGGGTGGGSGGGGGGGGGSGSGSGGGRTGAGEALADVFNRTIETLRDITLELPSVRSPQEAADAFLKEDRKMYVGIVLVALAVLALLVAN